jgi:hypothetical protein
MRTEKLGYHYQYSEICYSQSSGGGFTETTLLSGVWATDWSWNFYLGIMIKMEQDIL